MAFDNTTFNIDKYAADALSQYSDSPKNADDDQVVRAVAHLIFDGFVESDAVESFENMSGYYDAADAWSETVGEMDDEQRADMVSIGSDLLSQRLIENAEDLEELCDALNEIHADLAENETMEDRLSGNTHDLCSLPVFSKNDLSDTRGVWSYDDDNAIVTSDDNAFEIKPRSDREEAAA
jgi:hypothetical protein